MRRPNQLLSAALFLVGISLALTFSWSQLRPVLASYALIPTLLVEGTEPAVLDFGCWTAECASCLHGIEDTPDAIVLTGASTFSYALNLEQFSKSMPRPVVNCMKNDSRIDAYRSFFNHARLTQPAQIMFHGYNSWAVNSPGTWTADLAAAFFVMNYYDRERVRSEWVPPWARPAMLQLRRLRAKVNLVLLYAHLFMTRAPAESLSGWRGQLSARYQFYAANNLKYWPLSRDAHQQRRLVLMKRHFGISAYVRSFMMDAYTQRPASEITARYEAFLAAIAPTRKVVFFTGPELTEVFPEQPTAIMAQSKRIMLETIAGLPDVHHVDVDFRSCGVSAADFWNEALMSFDVAHANVAAVPKATDCIAAAIKDAGRDRFLAKP